MQGLGDTLHRTAVAYIVYQHFPCTLTDSDERMIHIFERNIIRTIYHLSRLYKDTPKIRAQRVQWLGYLIRMNDEILNILQVISIMTNLISLARDFISSRIFNISQG